MIKSNLQLDIVILRLLAIIIVVFFHAYGMTYACHLPEAVATIYRSKYELFNQSYLINIAMPMFVVISGYLFGRQLDRKKYDSFWIMAWHKFKRLMIPFFVFAILFMVTTNSLSYEPFYRWTYWHLWYLPMLFLCFIVSYLFKAIIFSRGRIGKILLLLVLFALSLAGKFMPMILGLHNVSLWLCWFVLGMVVYQYYNEIFEAIHRYHLLWALVVIYILTSIMYYTEYGEHSVCGTLASLSGIFIIWYICKQIPLHKFRVTNLLIPLSASSFGIYIFHNWVELYMLSSTAQHIFPLTNWAEAHIYLFPFVFATIAFIISYIISYAIMKFRIGRALIG